MLSCHAFPDTGDCVLVTVAMPSLPQGTVSSVTINQNKPFFFFNLLSVKYLVTALRKVTNIGYILPPETEIARERD